MLFAIFIIGTIILTTLWMWLVEGKAMGQVYWWSLPIVIIVALVVTFVGFFLFALIGGLLSKPAKGLSRPRTFQRRITNYASQFVLQICNVDVVLKHAEKLPQDQKYLLVCNHQSNIDPFPIIWSFRKQHITFIMKDEVMKLPIVGTFLYSAGFLPLNRRNNREAVVTINQAADRIANNENIIAIFPEGTRSKGPDVANFHPGSLKIAQKAQCPIVVCCIDNAYKLKYHGLFKKTKVLLEVIKVINPEEYAGMNTIQMSEICRNAIVEKMQYRREQYEWLQRMTNEELTDAKKVGHFKTKDIKNKENKEE